MGRPRGNKKKTMNKQEKTMNKQDNAMDKQEKTTRKHAKAMRKQEKTMDKEDNNQTRKYDERTRVDSEQITGEDAQTNQDNEETREEDKHITALNILCCRLQGCIEMIVCALQVNAKGTFVVRNVSGPNYKAVTGCPLQRCLCIICVLIFLFSFTVLH